jgi:ribosomal peptide maturation radical SAM protein 1
VSAIPCAGEEHAPIDVALVLMPYAEVRRPSIALGILKAALTRAGIRTAVEYANLSFVEQIGCEAAAVVQSGRVDLSIGEWTFAGAAFPERPSTPDDLFAEPRRAGQSHWLDGRGDGAFTEVLAAVRALAKHFIEATARALLARGPRIVACSSTFEQHCASLALLRRVKQLDPAVVTLLGGANCEAEMGWATLREFPWIDFVVSGEADELIAPLCRSLLEHGAHVPAEDLPEGVLAREHVRTGTFGSGGAAVPRVAVARLDGVPVPEYSDYFARLERSPLRDRITPGLVAETSRGCWWGQKSQCTFCGLNGHGMEFRAKSSERALAELAELSGRYGIARFEIVDNILDGRYLRSVLPAIEASGAPYRLFYETKSNLRREQVAQLARAGVHWIQPGIEALHDDLLALMAKGCTAATNLQLLKYAREHGVNVSWLLLVGFPGEEDRWHEEVAEWLPRVFHLQPPSACTTVRYDRFSVYHQAPERFGIELAPAPGYATLYPVGDDALAELAYFFVDVHERGPRWRRPGIEKLALQVAEWRKQHRRTLRPVLSMTDHGEAIDLYDTRPCATARRVTLSGIAAEVYRACDPALPEVELERRLATTSDAAGEVRAALERLDAQRLIVRIHGRVLALAVPGDAPALRDNREFPGGTVDLPRPTPAAMARALVHLRGRLGRADAAAPDLVRTADGAALPAEACGESA